MPLRIEPIMADIATAFHWSLSELKALSVEEIMSWHKLALQHLGVEDVNT